MPETLRIRPWPDAIIDTVGHDPRSRYVETFYLPALGPTSVLFLRHVAHRFEESTDRLDVPFEELVIDLSVVGTAQALGLGPREGRSSPLFRTIARLQQFDIAVVDPSGTVAVRCNLPPLSRRHLQRLPEPLRIAHDRWLERGQSPRERGEGRARRTALTLVELGTDVDVVEHTLERMGFPPIPARAAAVWARAASEAMARDGGLSSTDEAA